MPELDNIRWERFAHAVISNLGNRTQAAIEAGYSRKKASNAGSRLWANRAIRARIKELMQPLDADMQAAIEDTKSMIYSRAFDISKGGDMAAVQSLRLIADLQLLGHDGEKLRQAQEKLDLERERLELQRKALEAAEDANNVRIIIDPQLNASIQQGGKEKNP